MYEKEIFLAINENKPEAVAEIILRKQTDLDYIDREESDGSPLLVCALNSGYTRIARQLILAGADVNHW